MIPTVRIPNASDAKDNADFASLEPLIIPVARRCPRCCPRAAPAPSPSPSPCALRQSRCASLKRQGRRTLPPVFRFLPTLLLPPPPPCCRSLSANLSATAAARATEFVASFQPTDELLTDLSNAFNSSKLCVVREGWAGGGGGMWQRLLLCHGTSCRAYRVALACCLLLRRFLALLRLPLLSIAPRAKRQLSFIVFVASYRSNVFKIILPHSDWRCLKVSCTSSTAF